MSSTSGSGEEIYSYPGKYDTQSEGSRYARVGIEGRECNAFLVRGTSRARVFRSGYRFKLKDHFRDDTNGEYVLTSVTHEAFDQTYRTGSDGEPHGYRNTFEALPKSVPYRPPLRARKPIVFGSQTALVVGVSGEEIYVDKYGRVKVQFYWDREGSKDENSSCWIRVSQSWAGKNWGWMTIPRIGQEVVVDFLEGDPDRPLITGRVYNADQTVPYTLPANQTQSGIKSRSSKEGGSDNFNEIRLEDKKGSELFNVQAEKDMKTLVKNDDTQTIQNDRKIDVYGKHTETIVKDTTIKITEGNLSVTLDKGNETRKLTVGNQSITLDTGNQSTNVSLGKIDTTAMQSITLTVGGSSIKIDPMGVTIQAPMIKLNAEMMVQIQADILLDMSGEITMINT
ncbi:MAG: type VI secretion system tip protein VgrG [Acidobacteriaceae bacterium]|nr:type VI secretion system tip protein VgrG [Acidobacteriaceae bacterium]